MMNKKYEQGITLIALVVTIIVLLILAGVAISLTIGNNGLFSRAQNATAKYEEASVNEQSELDKVLNEVDKLAKGIANVLVNSVELNTAETTLYIGDTVTLTATVLPEDAEDSSLTWSSSDTNIATVNENGVVIGVSDGEAIITAKANDGSEMSASCKVTVKKTYTVTGEYGIKLTKENYADYLGKVVTNYKTVGSTETVTTNSLNYSNINEFTVSTTYRLYYVDFGNKYGDGEGTIYLKADCNPNNYTLSINKTTNASTIKNLNPSLYASGVTTPSGDNMKAVTWLLDKDEWSGLVTSGASTEIKDYVKYVVGAPSLEMMIDSFNTHYKLTGSTPDYSSRTENSARTKLFYEYPYNSNNYGYGVGPCATDKKEYSTYTSNYSVQTDKSIDSMYYPGDSQSYWLASPAAHASWYIMDVYWANGGFLGCNTYTYSYAFCPLVSISPDVQLELE